MVSKRIHSGRVGSIEGGIVTQKVDREGGSDLQDLRALSGPIEVCQVVDIKYVGGIGQVGGPAKAWEAGGAMMAAWNEGLNMSCQLDSRMST